MTEQEKDQELTVFEYPDFPIGEGRETVYVAAKSVSAAARALGMTRGKFNYHAIVRDYDNSLLYDLALKSAGMPFTFTDGGFEPINTHPIPEPKQEEKKSSSKKKPKINRAAKFAKIYALVVSLNEDGWNEVLDDLWRRGVMESSHKDFIQLVAQELNDLE